MSEEEKAKEQEARSSQEQAFQEAAQKAPGGAAGPEVTFASLIFSLSSTAFHCIWEPFPDPVTGEVRKEPGPWPNRPSIFWECCGKRPGTTWTRRRDNLFEHLLYDLRMAYIKEVG